MKTWEVKMPVTGIAVREVEAETEKEALEKAEIEIGIDDINEWCPISKIVHGNVFCGMLNEATAKEQK